MVASWADSQITNTLALNPWPQHAGPMVTRKRKAIKTTWQHHRKAYRNAGATPTRRRHPDNASNTQTARGSCRCRGPPENIRHRLGPRAARGVSQRVFSAAIGLRALRAADGAHGRAGGDAVIADRSRGTAGDQTRVAGETAGQSRQHPQSTVPRQSRVSRVSGAAQGRLKSQPLQPVAQDGSTARQPWSN